MISTATFELYLVGRGNIVCIEIFIACVVNIYGVIENS